MKYKGLQRNLNMPKLGSFNSESKWYGELVKQRQTLLPECRWRLPTMARCTRRRPIQKEGD